MDKTKNYLDKALAVKIKSKPFIFNLSLAADRKRLDRLFSKGKIQRVADDYEEEQLELFSVKILVLFMLLILKINSPSITKACKIRV